MIQNIDNKKLLSETIGVLRFPLMVCVVLIHIYIPYLGEHQLVNMFDNYVVESFVRIAVPLFFFISGYLFFLGIESFGFGEYREKLKNRVKRLFIPYLLWGVFAIVVKYFFYLLGEGNAIYLFDGNFKWIYYILWDPFNFQMWFVRDLFLVVLISPIIYFLIKRLKFVFVLITAFVWLCWHKTVFDLFGVAHYFIPENIYRGYGFDFVSLFFFSFGAWFALEKRDFTLDFKRLFPIAIMLYVGCTIGRFSVVNEYWTEIFKRFSIVFGLISAVVIVYELVIRNKVKRNMFLESGSQFIYYYHVLFFTFFSVLLFKFYPYYANSEIVYFLVYLFIPIITVLLGLGLYKVGMRWCPKVMRVILGMRN